MNRIRTPAPPAQPARSRVNFHSFNHADGPIRFHDEPGRQDRAAQAPDPEGHLAVVLPRCEDRRARSERLGQVDADQDHGGHRQGHRRRSHADAEPEHRLPAAGAAARSGQDGARSRRGGPRRPVPGEQEARRDLRGVRGAGCRLRRARGRAGEVRGDPRLKRRRQPRAAARSGRRRAAPAPVGREDRAPVGRREAPRRALQAAARKARHAAARRTDQPPGRRIGRLARAIPRALPGHRRRGHARSLLPRQRGRMDSRARPRPRHSVERQLQ